MYRVTRPAKVRDRIAAQQPSSLWVSTQPYCSASRRCLPSPRGGQGCGCEAAVNKLFGMPDLSCPPIQLRKNKRVSGAGGRPMAGQATAGGSGRPAGQGEGGSVGGWPQLQLHAEPGAFQERAPARRRADGMRWTARLPSAARASLIPDHEESEAPELVDQAALSVCRQLLTGTGGGDGGQGSQGRRAGWSGRVQLAEGSRCPVWERLSTTKGVREQLPLLTEKGAVTCSSIPIFVVRGHDCRHSLPTTSQLRAAGDPAPPSQESAAPA